jgi:hypothetical protein
LLNYKKGVIEVKIENSGFLSVIKPMASTVSPEENNTSTSSNSTGTVKDIPAATYEKSTEEVDSKTEKPTTYKVDQKELSRLLEESNSKTQAFVKMLAALVSKQAGKNAQANSTNTSDEFQKLLYGNGVVEIDEATRAEAKELISEDGYYGVKATSERILDFAKALSGGDPSKLEKLKEAALEGFNQAEKMWGGELPQISQDTRQAVIDGFDAMISAASAK